MVTLIFLMGLCGYVWANTLTLSYVSEVLLGTCPVSHSFDGIFIASVESPHCVWMSW